MHETTTDDPVFGSLIWDGFHHEGWGGSFVDPHYTGWGSVIDSLAPDTEEDEEESDAAEPDTSAQGFLSDLLSVAGKQLEDDEQAKKMIAAARDFAARVDAYDGSLDAAPLRKAGRLKVVVPNPKERPPTPQQQDAWQAFRAGGADLAEQVAAALLNTYQQQRPERVRWWRKMYEEAPATLLPVINDTKAMRAIVRPKLFAVPARPDGETCVAIVFESFWSKEDIVVRVRGGRVLDVAPLRPPHDYTWSEFVCARPEEIASPVFGRLQRGRILGGWNGLFHSDYLRGFHETSELRYRYRTTSELRSGAYRPMPPWDTVTGDFGLKVFTRDDARPTPAQEEAFRAFNADPAATAQQVLWAIFDWYRTIRPEWVKHRGGDDEMLRSELPDLKSPEGLLEIIQLESVCVLEASEYQPPTGPRELTITIGPKAGQKIKLPPLEEKPAGVAIVLSFHWQDEHGLGVRWRNGKIEKVGDWESAATD